MSDVNDGRDAFDARLQVLQRKGLDVEADAGIAVYDAVRTARSIAESLLPAAQAADIVALAALICAESTRIRDGLAS
jgi:hypothetical protein